MMASAVWADEFKPLIKSTSDQFSRFLEMSAQENFQTTFEPKCSPTDSADYYCSGKFKAFVVAYGAKNANSPVNYLTVGAKPDSFAEGSLMLASIYGGLTREHADVDMFEIANQIRKQFELTYISGKSFNQLAHGYFISGKIESDKLAVDITLAADQ